MQRATTAIERRPSEWQGTPYLFEEMGPGAGFKTGDFVQRKVGGATIERFLHSKLIRREVSIKRS